MTIIDRVKGAFNAFNKRAPTEEYSYSSGGMVTSYRPYHRKLSYGNARSIKAAIYNRIATDVSQIKMEVCRVDENENYLETIKDSGLNTVLTIQSNKDQGARPFIMDIVLGLIDEGVIAVCPIDTEDEVYNSEVHDYDILTMRVGKITAWKPDSVKVDLYDDRKSVHKELWYRKDQVAIIENPFYTIMNENDSTLMRLTRKLNLLDVVDEQTSSGKLDIIIQLPYVIKSEARRAQAEKRRKDIEDQLRGSKYGIAYTDGTEHITQLNRPAENNLMNQIEYLTNLLFSQLGITQSILDGTADEQTLNNYYERTIEPIVAAITDEFTRKFISRTAYTQGKRVKAFNNPFRFVPTSKLPDLADKLIRNEILTKNEFRAIIGYKPSSDPNANILSNPNINQQNNAAPQPESTDDMEVVGEEYLDGEEE